MPTVDETLKLEQAGLRRRIAELEQERTRLCQMCNTARGLVYVHDLARQRTIYANRETLQALGYAGEDLHPAQEEIIYYVIHPDDIASYLTHRVRLFTARDGEVLEAAYRIRHPNGMWHWLLRYDTILTRDDAGVPRQILGIVQDITAQNATQQAIGYAHA